MRIGEVAENEFGQETGIRLVSPAVNLAARITSLAQGGQILLTQAAFNEARQFVANHPVDVSLPLKWVTHGPYFFKGFEEPCDVFEVGVEGQSPLVPPSDTEKAWRVPAPGRRSASRCPDRQSGGSNRNSGREGSAKSGSPGTQRPGWSGCSSSVLMLSDSRTQARGRLFPHYARGPGRPPRYRARG